VLTYSSATTKVSLDLVHRVVRSLRSALSGFICTPSSCRSVSGRRCRICQETDELFAAYLDQNRRFGIVSVASNDLFTARVKMPRVRARERERVSRSFVFLLRSRSFLSVCLADVSLFVVLHPRRMEVRQERFMSNNLINKIGEVPDGRTSFPLRLAVRERAASRIWASWRKVLFSRSIDQY
jgi:hypothetical protein